MTDHPQLKDVVQELDDDALAMHVEQIEHGADKPLRELLRSRTGRAPTAAALAKLTQSLLQEALRRARKASEGPQPTHVGKSDYVKTALLIYPAEPTSITVQFNGRYDVQNFKGPFYVVHDTPRAYGAEREEFEAAHQQVGPCQWVKTEKVRVRKAIPGEVVESVVRGTSERLAPAKEGENVITSFTSGVSWLISDEELAARFVPFHPETNTTTH